MKHVWSVLCLSSIINADSKNLSLRECLERIQVTPDDQYSPKKAQLLSMQHDLVSFLIREKMDKQLTLRIQRTDPNGISLDKFEKKYSFQGNEFLRIRNRIHINNIPITTGGFYTYKIQLKNDNEKKFKTVAEIPLEIIIASKKRVE